MANIYFVFDATVISSIHEIFANQQKCKNCDVDNEGQEEEKRLRLTANISIDIVFRKFAAWQHSLTQKA